MAKLFIALLALGLVASASAMAMLPDEYVSFLKFMEDFKIEYPDETERAIRFEIFKENLAEIKRLNTLHDGKTVFGVTQFSAMTKKEFGEKVLMDDQYKKQDGIKYTKNPITTATPASIDWREKNVVSKIKNQGQCGSCWAFSATAALESQLAIKTGKHLLLSEQELLDCVTYNYGCAGGYLDTAYRYIGYWGQVAVDQYTPYSAEQNNCSVSTGAEKQAIKIQGYYDIIGGEESIATFVAENGPVSFGIMCPEEMMHYQSGVLDVPDCKKTMVGWHALAIVGYTDDYWIVKNSWSDKWGEKGYVRFKRGVNFCLIDSSAGGPIIEA